MKRHSVMIGAAMAFLLAGAGCENQGARSRGERARALVAEGALLLDVRTPGEFAGGHLPGALNIPLQELPARTGEVPAGRKVVVYCASGVRSAQARSLLQGKGYEVFNLGSWRDWGP